MQRQQLSAPSSKWNKILTPALGLAAFTTSILVIAINFGEDIIVDILFLAISTVVLLFGLWYSKIQQLQFDTKKLYIIPVIKGEEEEISLDFVRKVKVGHKWAGIYVIVTNTERHIYFIPGTTVYSIPGQEPRKESSLEIFMKTLEKLYEKQNKARQAEQH